jgi:cytochrome c oxidase subunit IV
MATQHSPHESHGHYILPKKTIYKVFWILVGLTILTVAAIQLDAGPLNVPIAMAIAIAKAALVVLYFMGLLHDNKVNVLAFIVGTIFVIVFLSFTLLDTAFRGDLGNVAPRTITDMERVEEGLRGREPAPEGQPVEPPQAGQGDAAGEAAPAEVETE